MTYKLPLTDEEKTFLSSHELEEKDGLDAKGLKRSEAISLMNTLDKVFAVNLSKCKKVCFTLKQS